MATATGTIKADLLARVGKGKPIVIGTIDIPVDVVLPTRGPRAHRRTHLDTHAPAAPVGTGIPDRQKIQPRH